MILKTLLIYTLVSQFIVLALLLWVETSGHSNVFKQVNTIPGPRRYLAWAAGIAATLLVAPFLIPWMCYMLGRCLIGGYREYKELSSLYMEMRLDPIHTANLDDELLEHFETHTPAAMTNGFELLGDFYLKEEPYNSKGRVLIGADQMVFADIGITMETPYVELISFFENGEYASTASIDEFSKAKTFGKHGMHVNAVGSMDFDQLLSSHIAFLDSIMAKTGQDVRQMDLPRWKDLSLIHI